MGTAALLAQALEVPLAYLFAEEDDQAELPLSFVKMSKSKRAKLLDMARQMSNSRKKK